MFGDYVSLLNAQRREILSFARKNKSATFTAAGSTFIVSHSQSYPPHFKHAVKAREFFSKPSYISSFLNDDYLPLVIPLSSGDNKGVFLVEKVKDL